MKGQEALTTVWPCCGSCAQAAPGVTCPKNLANATVFKRFRDRVKADIWQKRFDAVSGQPDMEYAMADATIVKVHRHGQGAKGRLKARP